MSETITAEAAFDSMVRAAEDPNGYVERWRESTGRRAVGVFPMNFPSEIVHATGLLPVVVQEDRVPITVGNNLISEFNCGYTRNLADQVAGGRLDVFDAFYMVDHCIELIGAADVIRELSPKPFYFGQLISSMDDPWTGDQARITIADLVQEIGRFAGAAISEDQLRSSIESFNRGRSLMRKIFQDRRSGNAYFTATQLQLLVKSSMIMAREEHNALLEVIVAEAGDQPRDERVRVHLSAHLCHAPKPELLELIESCGGVIVDDDLFTGARYISTDADESLPPIDALAQQYLQRNVTIPCPTRAQRNVDWDDYLVRTVRANGAEAVISLLVKYCEPHMLYLPEVRKGLAAAGIQHLQLETEHEGMPLEAIRTRVEAMFEQVRRARTSNSALAH